MTVALLTLAAVCAADQLEGPLSPSAGALERARGYAQPMPRTTAGGLSDMAVVYIAMGAGAEEALFAYSVRNLRERGGFHGEVFVLTDQPNCAPASTTVVFIPPSTVELDLNGKPISSNTSLPAESQQAETYYKSFKMQIFQYLPARIVYVLYLDTDIIPGLPIAQLLAERRRLGEQVTARRGAPTGQNETVDLVMFAEYKTEVDWRKPILSLREKIVLGQPFHGGAWLAKRGVSDGCLLGWLENVRAMARGRSKNVVRDQKALGKAVAGFTCNPAALNESFLLKSALANSRGELRVLHHVTRTGLLQRNTIADGAWYQFGEVLLGINATLARQLVPKSTLVQKLESCWRERKPEPISGFQWQTARNAECSQFASGSIQAQAVQAGWLPRTKDSTGISYGVAAALAVALLAGVAALSLVIRRVIGRRLDRYRLTDL